MLPDPLHPAVVHLPMALVVLIPLFVAGGLVAIRRGARPTRAWLVVVGLQAVLAASAWFALETGGREEERVEAVVAERYVEAHEEAAERFLLIAVVVLVVSGFGLLEGRRGAVGRALGAAGALVLVIAGYQVGHSGGELVYGHGAAAAYHAQPLAPGATGSADDEHDR